ncbi:DUF2635 domain-containing protein [Mesorhizobium sp. KR1-2]|uniref:DUF2635 domain-containing protein n=1 Tax=Mesorhizobium sp. KR1-2 TaxID=3156609 RepID=UPI0032B46492
MNLKPAPGRTVRDPVTKQLLADGGETRELDTFWRRRLTSGDVVEAEEAAAPEESAAPEAAGTPSGSSEEAPDAESEKTNSRRARRAAQAEE